MYLIAGLGNPGDKYKLTRHNIGFLVIDEMIQKATLQSNLSNPNFKAIAIKTSNTILAKPQTFMNLSGESIVAIADYYNIPNENIIIIHDDLDLAFGAIKFKIGGGHGGHNGLKSTIAALGTQDFARIKIGIGRPTRKEEIENYVLKIIDNKDIYNGIDIALEKLEEWLCLK